MALSSPAVSVESLASDAAGGDLDALGALFDHYADTVVRYLLLRVHDHETALDLASATWEKVARKIGTYARRGDSGGFPAWLFTIARNTLAEHYRWHSRRPEHLDAEMLAYDQPDTSASPDEVLLRKLESNRIAVELDGLPAAQRRCLLLRFFSGMSLNETAAVMDKSVGAVKQLQHRGLGLLRDRLGNVGLGEFATPLATNVTRLPAPTVGTPQDSLENLA